MEFNGGRGVGVEEGSRMEEREEQGRNEGPKDFSAAWKFLAHLFTIFNYFIFLLKTCEQSPSVKMWGPVQYVKFWKVLKFIRR